LTTSEGLDVRKTAIPRKGGRGGKESGGREGRERKGKRKGIRGGKRDLGGEWKAFSLQKREEKSKRGTSC